MTTIPARVLAIAEKIEDSPLDWKENNDGSIVIIFQNKGKLMFMPDFGADDPIPHPAFSGVIYTNEDAQEAVKTLAPAKPKNKKKEK